MKRNLIRYKSIWVTFASEAKADLIFSRDVVFP